MPTATLATLGPWTAAPDHVTRGMVADAARTVRDYAGGREDRPVPVNPVRRVGALLTRCATAGCLRRHQP